MFYTYTVSFWNFYFYFKKIRDKILVKKYFAFTREKKTADDRKHLDSATKIKRHYQLKKQKQSERFILPANETPREKWQAKHSRRHQNKTEKIIYKDK